VTGVLENFMDLFFRNQELKGNFRMNSKQLAVDFMTTGEDKIKAP
jgi:hypothetical protein